MSAAIDRSEGCPRSPAWRRSQRGIGTAKITSIAASPIQRRYVDPVVGAPWQPVPNERRAEREASSIEHYGMEFCSCFNQYGDAQPEEIRFHGERQDTSAQGWQHLLTLIDEAAANGREVFKPLRDLNAQERRQVITLPSSIGRLGAVKHFELYRSNIVRIPPEIGAMTSLERFIPYTSHRLHWFPYELTRCSALRDSIVSTRSLYGNRKHRPPFPALESERSSTPHVDLTDLDPQIWGATTIDSCSVCGERIQGAGFVQAWVSRWVGTDVLPLLVNACSLDCIADLQEKDNPSGQSSEGDVIGWS